MTYFDTSFGIANPRTFSAPLAAPASVEDGSTTQSGHLDGVDSIFDCPEGHSFYESGTLPYNTTGFEPEGGSQYTTVATRDMSAGSSYLGGFTRTPNATASASATAAPLFADYGAHTHGFDLLSEPLGWDFSTLLTPSLTNASSIPSPPTDDIGGRINTLHAHEMLASNFVSLSDLLSDFGTLGAFQAEQVPSAPPYWDGINFASLTQRDDASTSAPVGMFEKIPYVHFIASVLFTGEILGCPIPDFPRPSSWLNYADNTAVPTDVLTATTTSHQGTPPVLI
ncbi:hypothetical protein EDB85DRAFT_1927612 [Lactarius pseudohatsudake]|nr:hypothetical protein EDB85DRAFT_1927612 [Lactarius pseudohatsudake]